VGSDAIGRTLIHESLIHGSEAYWGGAVASFGYGDFISSLDSQQRQSLGGTKGVGAATRIGLEYSMFVDSSRIGYSAPVGSEIAYVPFTVSTFRLDRSIVEDGLYAIANAHLSVVVMPPFDIALPSGDIQELNEDLASFAILQGTTVTGSSAVQGGGCALVGSFSS